MTNDPEAALSEHAAYERDETGYELTTTVFDTVVETDTASEDGETRYRVVVRLPTLDAVVATAFPIAWFFGMLYYTEVPGVLLVVATVVAATQRRHWLAGGVRASE